MSIIRNPYHSVLHSIVFYKHVYSWGLFKVFLHYKLPCIASLTKKKNVFTKYCPRQDEKHYAQTVKLRKLMLFKAKLLQFYAFFKSLSTLQKLITFILVQIKAIQLFSFSLNSLESILQSGIYLIQGCLSKVNYYFNVAEITSFIFFSRYNSYDPFIKFCI